MYMHVQEIWYKDYWGVHVHICCIISNLIHVHVYMYNAHTWYCQRPYSTCTCRWPDIRPLMYTVSKSPGENGKSVDQVHTRSSPLNFAFVTVMKVGKNTQHPAPPPGWFPTPCKCWISCAYCHLSLNLKMPIWKHEKPGRIKIPSVLHVYCRHNLEKIF